MIVRWIPHVTTVFCSLLALACAGSAIERPGGEGTGGATSTGGAHSDADGLNIQRGNDPRPGGGGETGQDAVVLPPFDCSDPLFFPLRIDEEGNPINYEGDADLGAGGASSGDVGDGDLTVLIVFDKSGSMAYHWGGKSRWQAGSDAVLLGLDGILDIVTLGALFFPFHEADAPASCGVPGITVPPQIDFTSGRGFKESWIAGACTAQPAGATPLERALEVADLALMSAQDRGLLKERKRVILVTDGEPTCNDNPTTIVSFPAKWSEMGIDTHVIGLPGSEQAHALLDEIAHAGGTEEHFSPTRIGGFEDQLYELLR